MSKEKKSKSSGGYMSVDREEAIEANWDQISKLTLPSMVRVETHLEMDEFDIHSMEFLRQT
jgi:hypothetical protein